MNKDQVCHSWPGSQSDTSAGRFTMKLDSATKHLLRVFSSIGIVSVGRGRVPVLGGEGGILIPWNYRNFKTSKPWKLVKWRFPGFTTRGSNWIALEKNPDMQFLIEMFPWTWSTGYRWRNSAKFLLPQGSEDHFPFICKPLTKTFWLWHLSFWPSQLCKKHSFEQSME